MCPACGAVIPHEMFLCLVCADAAPDRIIVEIGLAIDSHDSAGVASAIDEAVAVLNGE